MDDRVEIHFKEGRLSFHGPLVLTTVGTLDRQAQALMVQAPPGRLVLDLSHVNHVDTSGAALLDRLIEQAERRGFKVTMEGASPEIDKTLQNFSLRLVEPLSTETRSPSPFTRMVQWLHRRDREVVEFVYLLAEIFYYGIVSLWDRRGRRRGEFTVQSLLIGVDALPIVGTVSFLIGFILALQSAAQLRQFGANIYVADLVAIAMTREMGPLITAVLIAGRSGSAITSEIATMAVSEETDALRSMGLSPIKYVVIPKLYAITLTMPLLTVLSMLIGILGGVVIGYTYLDIAIKPFLDEVVSVLVIKDIVTGLIKSLVFAWLILVIAVFYGFRTRGGPAEVGRATTYAVVASIFAVIFADSILGLIFYFGQDLIVY